MLIIVFLVIIASSISLLLINYSSKNNFATNLESVKIEKMIKIYISYSRLCLFMLYSFANTDENFWKNFVLDSPL